MQGGFAVVVLCLGVKLSSPISGVLEGRDPVKEMKLLQAVTEFLKLLFLKLLSLFHVGENGGGTACDVVVCSPCRDDNSILLRLVSSRSCIFSSICLSSYLLSCLMFSN